MAEVEPERRCMKRPYHCLLLQVERAEIPLATRPRNEIIRGGNFVKSLRWRKKTDLKHLI